MGPFKFVHAADLHLGSPLGVVSANVPLSQTLRGASYRALERVVDICLEERVEFLVLAGDLYDTKDRSVKARLFLREQLLRLDRAGISTFVVHGNHDPLHAEAGGLNLPASVKVFGPTWEEVELRRDGRCVCRVQGISYPTEWVTENLSRFFRRMGPEFTVGILHANVGADTSHANYSPCSWEDLSSRQLDYWALGHVHTRAERPLDSGGVAVYPGNTQGRHAKETGERGCVLVEVEGESSRRRFIPTHSVQWHLLALDLSRCSSVEEIIDAAAEKLDGLDLTTGDAHAVRLSLLGPTALHRELGSPEALQGIEDALRQQWVFRNPPVALECLEDKTAPAVDEEKLRSEGGLPAEVLAMAQKARVEKRAQDAVWSSAELEKLEGALRRAGLGPFNWNKEMLLTRAAERALSLLLEDA